MRINQLSSYHYSFLIHSSSFHFNDNDYYGCYDYGYVIYQIDTNGSGISNYIEKYFDGIETTTLTGNCYPDKFTTKRLIIIEMK